MEAEDAQAARLHWSIGLVQRAEDLLRAAFEAGPRSAMQRYKARSAALNRFHGGLRGTKPVLPDLANHWRQEQVADTEVEDV